MNEKVDKFVLEIGDEVIPRISLSDADELKEIQKQFMESYLSNKDKMSLEEWLNSEMQRSLPECSSDEVKNMTKEIITTIKVQEEKKASLEKAIENGRSKESWFASETQKATSLMTAHEASKYLDNLDKSLHSANDALYKTIHTQAGFGPISQNPNLDGFIAEQYHAQTFNLNAEATGSPYRAKVLEPKGNGYAKNSVDIVIVDGEGNIVKRYQSKYCKDANATSQAFEKGDYRGQQKLVPEEQNGDISKKSTNVLEAPDGTTSNPLTKDQAKEMQTEAQSGNWNELNWNEYRVKDLAIGVGKQAGQAAIMGAAIGVGFDVAQKVWHGEKIDGEELVEKAITSGADFGVKAAAAGALKVGVEKGVVPIIPKGTPAGTISNIVFVAVENAKIIGKMAKGELTPKEGVDKMQQTSISTVAGIVSSAKGAAVGAKLGAVFGPVGSAIGGFVGGTIGYMAGSKVGEKVVQGAQKIRDKSVEITLSLGSKVTKGYSAMTSGIRNICGGVKSLFSF